MNQITLIYSYRCFVGLTRSSRKLHCSSYKPWSSLYHWNIFFVHVGRHLYTFLVVEVDVILKDPLAKSHSPSSSILFSCNNKVNGLNHQILQRHCTIVNYTSQITPFYPFPLLLRFTTLRRAVLIQNTEFIFPERGRVREYKHIIFRSTFPRMNEIDCNTVFADIIRKINDKKL